MIGKLQGIVDYIGENYAILMTAGVGYRVFCPSGALSALKTGESAALWIETNVREDHIHLFGFESRAAQDLFLRLTSVSGVGPKMAMAIMGAMNTNILFSAIATGDVKTLTAAPGVGKKVAERIIVELKGKITAIFPTGSMDPDNEIARGSAYNDLLSALESLGYRRVDMIDLAQKLCQENPNADVGALVRMALKQV
jgi:Holliday junction DNA helicase RuvA